MILVIGSSVSAAYCQQRNVSASFARGCEQMMHKNFSSAISSFTEAISDDKNDVNSYFRRGQSFFCLGRYKDAIVDFDRAASKGAMDPNVFLWRGTAYAKLDNDELAIQSYEKAMRLNPSLADTYKSVTGKASVAPETVTHPPSATESRLAAATESPAPPSATDAATESATQQLTAPSGAPGKSNKTLSFGSSQRAVDDYKTAVKNVTENVSGYFRAGTTYSGIMNLSGALIPLPGLNDDPANWVEGKERGKSYFSLKDARKSARDLDARINEHPQDSKLFFLRARAFQQLGKSADTLADLTRAIELDNSNPHYYLARAFYHFQHGETHAADSDIRSAQELNPIVPADLSFEALDTKEKSTKS
jgi:tetratricopeptide (TPR) repeat protein